PGEPAGTSGLADTSGTGPAAAAGIHSDGAVGAVQVLPTTSDRAAGDPEPGAAGTGGADGTDGRAGGASAVGASPPEAVATRPPGSSSSAMVAYSPSSSKRAQVTRSRAA